jgi:hypothetical protein
VRSVEGFYINKTDRSEHKMSLFAILVTVVVVRCADILCWLVYCLIRYISPADGGPTGVCPLSSASVTLSAAFSYASRSG